MQDNLPPPPAATGSPRTTRWNPYLPFIVSGIGSLASIFAAGTTLLSAITTFTLCFTVAYLTQIVLGRFLVPVALFDTVSTTDGLDRHKYFLTVAFQESKN